MKRRIFRNFKIAELSAVDMPAQQGAKALIVKSAKPVGAEKVDKELEALKAAFADLQKRHEELEKRHADIMALPPTEMDYFRELNTTEREGFLKAAPAQRATLAASRVCVYKSLDGTEYFGDTPAKFVEIAKKLDEKIKAEETATFAKRAADMLPNVKESDSRVVLAKALGDTAEGVEMLKSIDAAFKALGTAPGFEAHDLKEGGGEVVTKRGIETELAKMANAYAAKEGVDHATAYIKVTSFGEGRALAKKLRSVR